jgi:uncharacterized protein YbjT (DUF2867 family)
MSDPSPHQATNKTVVIAGATGFVGRALLRTLTPEHSVIALSRSIIRAPLTPNLTWRSCDLFDLEIAERALAGADIAVYLVHSMLPQARLTQARFEDLDLVCADNFARAARKCGVGHIVYLGGLLPRDATKLSRHLSSRLEVEKALGSHGVPVITLRAGLIIGPNGSSFDMMSKLVGRLPVMLAPAWSGTLTQPIALADVIPLLEHAIHTPTLSGRAYDIGGPDVVSYAEILRITGDIFGRPVRVFTLPIRTANLSLLWVSLITGTPQALVRPLVESLEHNMVVTDGGELQAKLKHAPQTLHAAITEAASGIEQKSNLAFAPPLLPFKRVAKVVCSVQRLQVPTARTAAWVAQEYLRCLPGFLGPLFSVRSSPEGTVRFHFRPISQPILELTPSHEGATPDRQLFTITGGLLATREQLGHPRLEFRFALDPHTLLVGVYDFVPSLPWPIYRYTQAPFHQFVMGAFGRHLARKV